VGRGGAVLGERGVLRLYLILEANLELLGRRLADCEHVEGAQDEHHGHNSHWSNFHHYIIEKDLNNSMTGYIFKTSDLEACSDYPDASLHCSPGGCKVCGVSEDSVMLYETKITPLVSGNFEETIKINNWKMIEDHGVLEVTPGSLIFDGEYYTKSTPGEYLDSRLPGNVYIAKLPMGLREYSGHVVFSSGRDLLVKLVDEDVTLKVPTIYSNSEEDFSLRIHSEFLRDYVTGEYIKMYLEEDYPLCIEDTPHFVYIAPCLN